MSLSSVISRCARRVWSFRLSGVREAPTKNAYALKNHGDSSTSSWHAARSFVAMRSKLLCSAAILPLALLVSSSAMAQELEEVEVPPPLPSTEPSWRIDFIGPTVGIGAFLAPTVGYGRLILTLGGEVRFAHASGSGVLVRVAHGSNLWGGGTAVDLAYLHRLSILGTARKGGSIDFTLGPSFAWLSHNQGDVPTGATLGGQAGVALTGRDENFSASVGAQFHGFMPLEGAPNGGPTGFEMAITVMGGLGFGFYG